MKIYQVYYNEESKKGLDRQFIPYDNTNPAKEKEYEYGVIRNIYNKLDPFKDDKLFGVLSWKFKEKTGLNGKDFISWINKNKGYDVYIVNPFPELSYLFYNSWYQGEYWHPGLLELTEKLFNEGCIDLYLNKRHDINSCSFCNYFVANKKFYKEYIYYCEKLYNAITNTDDKAKKLLFDVNVYGGDTSAAFFPFIFERMLSTIITNKNFKVLVYNNIDERLKHEINKNFVIKASDFLRNKHNFTSYDIEYLNSFGNMYNDMVVNKFVSYNNYMCGKVL